MIGKVLALGFVCSGMGVGQTSSAPAIAPAAIARAAAAVTPAKGVCVRGGFDPAEHIGAVSGRGAAIRAYAGWLSHDQFAEGQRSSQLNREVK
jgi:hypothetical protein